MPRQRKPPGPTANGGYRPGGPPGGALAPGQPYGESTQLTQAVNAVPMAPSPTAGPGPPPSPGGPGPAPPDGQGGPPGGLAGALQAALQASPPPPGGLLRPTDRPHEPITAGLSSGDGPGPEMLGQTPNPVVDTLQRVADLTGDPALAGIAARAKTMSGQ